jgi:hypothetical protein
MEISTSAAPPGDPASERFLEVPFSAAPGGLDLSGYTHLDFRVGRAEAEDPLTPTPLVVQLLNADGSLSEPVDASAHGVRLDGPVGGPFGTHVVLQTARMPLTAFVSATRAALRGVRFGFPGAAGARLFLGSVRAALGSASLSPVQATAQQGRPGAGSVVPSDPGGAGAPLVSDVIPGARPRVVRQLSVDGNAVVALRSVENHRIELELTTPQAFQAQGDQLVLDIGDQRATQSRHPAGSLTRVVFTLDARFFVNTRDGERIRVRYASNDARQWDFGPLDKSRLQP